MTQEIFSKNKLTNSQHKGIIKLLYKKGEREDIKNWRPLTLLNTDYKIIAKILSNRLKTVLPKIIHTDQKGFVAGRNIMDANRLLQDIIDYCDIENQEGSMIFLDQQKAFDRIEWGWVMKCLHDFKFGNIFCNWINMLLINSKTCIQTNGFTSSYFEITRSARQGCPISPLLYILQIEPLACAFRSDTEIKGIKLPGNIESKLNMFADDTQLMNRTEKSIEQTFKWLKIYEQASGSKINYTKTEGIYLGPWKNKEPIFTKIKWTKTAVKTLGIFHGHVIDNDKIWKDKIQKIKNCLQVWKTRNLTLKGKTLIIKSFIISLIGFEIEARGIPEKYMQEINKLIWDYLWDGKVNLVERKVCCNSRIDGGMGMINLMEFIENKQVKTVYKIIHTKAEAWNTIGKFYLKILDNKYLQNNFLASCSDLNGLNINNKIPKFYYNNLKAWANMKSKIAPEGISQISSQPLFGNKNIQLNRKPLFLPSFSKSGIKKISDLWDWERKQFINNQQLLRKLVIKTNWIAEITKIKKAIPKQYIEIMQGQEPDRTPGVKKQKLYINNKLEICALKINHFKILKPHELKISFLHNISDPIVRPKSEMKWNTHFQKEISWEKIWENCKNTDIAITSKIEEFHWKSIHKIIYTESKLSLMNRSNGLCHMCNTEIETLTHLFFYCTFSNQLIDMIHANLYNNPVFVTANQIWTIDEEKMILGDITDNTIATIANTIILTTKWVIWKARNIKKFQNKTTSPLSAYTILKKLLKENISLYIKITPDAKKRWLISKYRTLLQEF